MTDNGGRATCAATSRRLDEPMGATASRVHRWFVVEQPGSWGATAIFESGLDPDVAAAVKARANEARARMILIRRGPGRGSGAERPRIWYAARSDPPTPGLASGTFTDEATLPEIDVDAACRDAGGTEPVFLVCTNGKHDPCCAEYGRPVYRELVEQRPEAAVFECSHIGGDRFAANVVCLPEGVYYGRVPVDGVGTLVDRYRKGRLDLDLYRGRSCYGVVEQRAEIAVRQAEALDGFGDVAVVADAAAAGDADEWTVRVRVLDRDERIVRLRVGRAAERLLSCGHTPGPPRVFEVLDLVDA